MNKADVKREKEVLERAAGSTATLSKADRLELLRLRCRTDFLTFAKFITSQVPGPSQSIPFLPYKVHATIGALLQKIGDGDEDVRRSAVSLPPRTGKSLLISKIFPAWQFGRTPHGQFIMSSYSLKLTNENARAVIEYVTSPSFAWVFPEFSTSKKKCNLKIIRSDQGGLINIASAGSNVTGFGYGVIDQNDLPGIGILDDLLADGNSLTTMESTYNWTSSQFLNRMLPNYAIISMGTRFHTDDIIGRLLKADPEGWHELNVPAFCVDEKNDVLGRALGESHWPEMFTVETLEGIKKNMSERDFNSLYMGRPQGEDGAIFKEFWFNFHKQNKREYAYIFATVDTACKADSMNDFSAICVWGYDMATKKLHLIHYVLDRMEFPELTHCVKKVVEDWSVRILYIEPRSSGISLIQCMQRELNIQIKELIPDKDKVLRANSVSMLVEKGLVSLYENLPNLPDRISELCAFPYIKNKDFVDAFVYGLIVLQSDILCGRIKSGGDRPTLPLLNYGQQRLTGGSHRETSNLFRQMGVRNNKNYV